MHNNYKEVSILLGVKGYTSEDFEFYFADLILKKDLINNKMLLNLSLNSFKPLILTDNLITERVCDFVDSLKDKERLQYLDDCDCKPSDLPYVLSKNYANGDSNSIDLKELFDGLLYNGVLDIPDGEGGFLEFLLEDQGSSTFIPDLSHVLINDNFLQFLLDLKRDNLLNASFTNSIELSNESLDFLNENLLLNEKNDTYNCVDIIKNWLTDNIEDLLK